MLRITRRRVLLGSGAALAVGAGASLLAASRSTIQQSASPIQPSPPVVPWSPTTTSNEAPRGGSLALAVSASFDFDVLDALRTGSPSVIELLGRVHPRLLQWSDPTRALLGPDLAAAIEHPDSTLLVLTLDPRARWHDTPPLDGRPVTEYHVAASLERTVAAVRAADTLAARRSAPLADIARVEVAAPSQLRLVLERPSPLLSAALAGEFALVQPPDLDERLDRADPLAPELLGGCGPWRSLGFDGAAARFLAHTAGHRPPLLEYLTVTPPFDCLERYRAGELDEFPTIDPREADAARAFVGIHETRTFLREPVISTFVTTAPPWSNVRLLHAISGALNRSWLAATLFGGRAEPAAPLPPAYASALPQSELIDFLGFSPDAEADARDARQRWEAAGGPALGIVTVDVPAIFDPRYAAAATIVGRLNAILGEQFRPAIARYPDIATRLRNGYYGNGRAAFWFGWGPSLPSPDPRQALLTLHGHALDPSISAPILAAEPSDEGAFAGVQRQLLAGASSGVLLWVQQTIEVFRRSGTVGPDPSPFWDGHRDSFRHRTA